MVKRDSKDRVKSPNENPPNLLPRGKNSNNHDFLIDDSSPTKSSTLPRSFRSEDLKDLKHNGPIYSGVVKPSMIHGYKRRVRNKIFKKNKKRVRHKIHKKTLAMHFFVLTQFSAAIQ